jgi:hypothetical protein
MALVSVMLMLTVLLILAHIFAEKVWQSTRQVAEASNRERVFWAAQAGVESARQWLSLSYANSGGWRTFLIADTPLAYPTEPAWVTEINGASVAIYLRDNPDGDDDVGVDNDLKVFVLARARGQQGTETMVESLCGLELPAEGGQGRPVLAVTAAGPRLSEQPVSSYVIVD